MANFEAYQEYQRIEDFEEDSPPGEEDLLVHVPEGLKGKHVTDNIGSCKLELFYPTSITRGTLCPMHMAVFGLLLSNVVFMLQTHGIISRTWITSSQEYPYKQIQLICPCLLTEAKFVLNQPLHIYHFHQKNGFACMMLSEFFELV